MSIKSRRLFTYVFLGCWLPALSTQAAFDAFLQFFQGTAPVTEGESQEQKFEKAVTLKSFNLGAESVVTPTAGLPTTKLNFLELNIAKEVDTASPSLFQACGLGAHYDSVKLAVRKSGATDAYLVYTFRSVVVKAMKWNGASGDESVGETVRFTYDKFQIDYFPAGAKSPISASWDQLLNKGDMLLP